MLLISCSPGFKLAMLALCACGMHTVNGDLQLYKQHPGMCAVTLQEPCLFMCLPSSCNDLRQNQAHPGEVRVSVLH